MSTFTRHRMVTDTKGFTLIELLIAVTIVGILTAIAYPSYQRHVVKSQRSAAEACLSQYAQFMERYYTTSLTYVGAAPGVLGCAAESGMDANYGFRVENLGTTTYTAVAQPTAAFALRDARCGSLTLNQRGQRGAGSGSTDDIKYCW
ncbi:MAG: type IV pilin protein [Steroidobacteraceae bacterium]